MAKDNEIDFDTGNDINELNLDELNFDDEFDFEKEMKKAANEPVTPVNIAKKTIKGMVTVDKERVKKFIKKGVPASVGDSYDKFSDHFDDISRAVSRNTNKLKQELNEMGKTIDTILPESGMIRDLFSKIYNPKEEKIREEQSREERELANVKSDLLEGFGDIAEMQEMQNKVNNLLSDKRTQSTNQILKSMASNIGFLKEYNFQYTSKFQNKLLEVQIHSLYVLSDIRQVIRESNEQNQEKLTAIVQNTGLPDLLKARNNFAALKEEFKARQRNQLVDRLYNNKTSKMIREKIDNKIDSMFESVFSFLGLAKMGVDSVGMQSEMNKMMGRNLNDTAADMVRDKVDGTIAGRLGKFLGSIPVVNKVFKFMSQAADDPNVILNQAADKVGNKTFLHTLFGKGLRELGDLLDVKESSNSADLSRANMDEVAEFDYRTRNSINRVIPAYLRKIHAEIMAERMGYRDPDKGYIDSKGFELHYNERTDNFKSLSDFKSKVGSFIKKTGRDFRLQSLKSIDSNLFDKRLGLKGEMKKNDRLRISKWLTMMSAENNISATQLLSKISAQDIVDGAGVDEETANLFLSKVHAHLDNPDNYAGVTKLFNNIKRNMPGFHPLIEELFKANNAEILIDAGLMTKDEDGNLTVNDAALHDLAFENYGLGLDDKAKAKNKAIIDGLVEYNKSEFSGSIGENLEKAGRYGRAMFKAGKRKMERTDAYRWAAEHLSEINNKYIAPKIEGIKGKASEISSKVLSHPMVTTAALMGQSAYNIAIDKIVDQLGAELDEAEKSELIQKLKKGYKTVHGKYEEFLGNDKVQAFKSQLGDLGAAFSEGVKEADPELAKQIHQDNMRRKALGELPQEEKKGFLQRFFKSIGGTAGEIKNSLANTDEMKSLVALAHELQETELMQKAKEKYEHHKNAATEYLSKLKSADSAKDAVKMVGEDAKIDTTDTRNELLQHENVSNGVKAIQEAAKSGDRAFFNETLAMLKRQGLDKYKSIKDAANAGLKLFKNRDNVSKQAEKHILEIRDPIDAIAAMWKLGSGGVGLLPIKSTLKLGWRIVSGIIRHGWKTESWLYGGLLKRGWNESIGRIGDMFGKDWKFKRNANVTGYLNPLAMLGGAGGGILGGLWRNKGRLGSAGWSAGKGLVDLAKVPLNFLTGGIPGVVNGDSGEAVLSAMKNFGSAISDATYAVGDTTLNVLDQYDSLARGKGFNNAFGKKEEKKKPWYKRIFSRKNAFDEIDDTPMTISDLNARLHQGDPGKPDDGNKKRTLIGSLNSLYEYGKNATGYAYNKAMASYYDSSLANVFSSKADIEKHVRNETTLSNQARKGHVANALRSYKEAALKGDHNTMEMIKNTLLENASTKHERAAMEKMLTKYDGQGKYNQAKSNIKIHQGTGNNLANIPAPEQEQLIKARSKKRYKLFVQYEEAVRNGEQSKLKKIEEELYASAKTDAEKAEITKFLYRVGDANGDKILTDKEKKKWEKKQLKDNKHDDHDKPSISSMGKSEEASLKLAKDKEAQEQKLEKLTKEKMDAALQLGAITNFLNSKPEVQEEALAYVERSSEFQPVKKMGFFGKMKTTVKKWIMDKLKKGGKKVWDFLKMLGGKTLGMLSSIFAPIIGPMVGPIMNTVLSPLIKLLGALGFGGIEKKLMTMAGGAALDAALGLGASALDFGGGNDGDKDKKKDKNKKGNKKNKGKGNKKPKGKKPSRLDKFKKGARWIKGGGKVALLGYLGYQLYDFFAGDDDDEEGETEEQELSRSELASVIATDQAHDKSQGACAKYVRVSLNEAGYQEPDGRPTSAYQYATTGFLNKYGFNNIDVGDPLSYKPEMGDISVTRPFGEHKHGHIAIYNGENWVSDFKQRSISIYSDLPRDQARDYIGIYRDQGGAPQKQTPFLNALTTGLAAASMAGTAYSMGKGVKNFVSPSTGGTPKTTPNVSKNAVSPGGKPLPSADSKKVPDSKQNKPKKNPKVENAKKETVKVDEKVKKQTPKPKPGPGKSEPPKGLVDKIKSALKSFCDKIKNRIVKKIGKTSAGRLLARLAGIIAPRLIAFVGWALLIVDAGYIAYYMLQGKSLLSAISLNYLGFDVFSDDPEDVPVDENGNVIEMAPDDLAELEKENTPEVKEEETATREQVDPKVQQEQTQQSQPSNPNAIRTSTSQNTTSQGTPFDMSIFKSNLNVSEKQLVVMMSSNEELKKMNKTLSALVNTFGGTINNEEPKQKTDSKMTYEATSSLNNSRSYSI